MRQGATEENKAAIPTDAQASRQPSFNLMSFSSVDAAAQEVDITIRTPAIQQSRSHVGAFQ